MTKAIMPVTLTVFFLLGVAFSACGASQPQPEAEDDGQDLISSIVGNVDTEGHVDDDGDPVGEAYQGPTALTINLKVVNDKNPKGSFRLLNSDGSAIIEKGKLGEVTELSQGVYTIEFKSPLVFGDTTYVVEDVEVAGKKMELTKVFPAGQITLHTYKGSNTNRCVPVAFEVKSKTEEKNLPGKGKTCQPLVLNAGTYEVLLNISKKKVQPVALQVNAEQVSSAKVKLDK